MLRLPEPFVRAEIAYRRERAVHRPRGRTTRAPRPLPHPAAQGVASIPRHVADVRAVGHDTALLREVDPPTMATA